MLVSMYNGKDALENSLIFPQKVRKSYHMSQQSHSQIRIYPRVIKIYINTKAYTQMFIEILFTIARK